jgi:hypothetical protein
MAISRERKILIAIFGIAIMALGADRLFLDSSTDPNRASAAMSAMPSASRNTKPSPQKNLLQSTGKPTVNISEQLAAVSSTRKLDVTKVKDAFVAPVNWSGAPAEQQKDDEQALGREFTKKHRLMAVMVADGGHYAIVDGRCYSIGHDLDGFVLERLTQRSSHWQRGHVRVELSLNPSAK